MPAAATTLGECAEELAQVAGRQHGNEAELRHNLYVVLQPFCVNVLEMEPGDIRHEIAGRSGRFDTLFGRVLIEYKTPGRLASEANRRTDAQQTIDYLRDEGVGADVAILTDGHTWGILRDLHAEPEPGEQAWLVLEELPQTPLEQFNWRSNSVDTARRILELFGTMRSAPVSAESLVARLGLEQKSVTVLVQALTNTLDSREDESRADILFRQWVALAGVSYGIDDAGAAWPKPRGELLGVSAAAALPGATYASSVFLLHSYIALAAKLIAAEVLALSIGKHDDRPTQWLPLPSSEFARKFDDLESGALAARLRAPGLMGADLFGWYAPLVATSPTLESALRGLLRDFAGLAWARLAHTHVATGDLLRDFYAAVVPRGLRKSLGEFFTPRWIAERVVAKAIDLRAAAPDECLRFLDPTCGSGTFLVVALRRALRAAAARGLAEDQQTVEAIESVYGFDINPVSPLMARVNLLLALGDRVEALSRVRFHVYEADSLLLPETFAGQATLDAGHEFLRLPLVIGDIDLPEALGTLGGVSTLARLIEQSLANERDDEGFARRLKPELSRIVASDADADEVRDAAVAIYSKIRELKKKRKDGVWASVIEQAFAPQTAGTFDIVVGNPPWISWRNLPSTWKERSQPLWARYGLWQARRTDRAAGTPFSDISSLVVARAVRTYAPTGVVALLLPDSVLMADPGGRPLRRCLLAPDAASRQIPAGSTAASDMRFRPLHVDDFSSLSPFPDAATKPIALYVRSGEAPVFPFPSTAWTRATRGARLRTSMPWREASKWLQPSDDLLRPLDLHDVGSRWRRPAADGDAPLRRTNDQPVYTWGEGFNSRGVDGLMTLEVLSGRPDPQGLVRVRTCYHLGRGTKGRAEREGVVEPTFLFPLIRGADIERFNLLREHAYYVLVLHDRAHLDRVLTVEQVIAQSPQLYDFLEPSIPEIGARPRYGNFSPTANRPWGLHGAWQHFGPAAHLVVTRYIYASKRPPFSVAPAAVDPRLGRLTTSLPNTKANFLSVGSAEEAHYISAALNSPAVQGSIERQCSGTAIAPAILSSIALPRFDPGDSTHARLAELGKEASLGGDLSSINGQIDALVSRLWHR